MNLPNLTENELPVLDALTPGWRSKFLLEWQLSREAVENEKHCRNVQSKRQWQRENCAVEEARVTEAGGKVIRPKFSIGDFGWVTLCQDTEGNMFGLNSLK